MFRLQNNVPNVYVDFSRDFQLFCRLYDVVNSSVREEIDSMMHLTDTKFIQSNALEILQTKLGFFTNKGFSEKELRYTLSAFPILLKNKGTKLGIKQAVNVWANINHFNGKYNVVILNKSNDTNYYTITIEFLEDVNLNYNVTILDEILRYILPTGYTLEYVIIKQAKVNGVGELFTSTDTYINNVNEFNNTVSIQEAITWVSDNDDLSVTINEPSKVFNGTKTFTYYYSFGIWSDGSQEIGYYGLSIEGSPEENDTITITITQNNSELYSSLEIDENAVSISNEQNCTITRSGVNPIVDDGVYNFIGIWASAGGEAYSFSGWQLDNQGVSDDDWSKYGINVPSVDEEYSDSGEIPTSFTLEISNNILRFAVDTTRIATDYDFNQINNNEESNNE